MLNYSQNPYNVLSEVISFDNRYVQKPFQGKGTLYRKAVQPKHTEKDAYVFKLRLGLVRERIQALYQRGNVR